MKNLLLVIFMLLVLSYLNADGTPPQGTGSEPDPFIIASLDNLLWLSTNSSYWSEGYYFEQSADIDASETMSWNEGEGFYPIGQQLSPFHGYYDGNGHVIDGLYINRTDYMTDLCLGLFGYTNGSEISSLGIPNVDISGRQFVSAFVGWNHNTVLRDCYSTGRLEGDHNIGGISGWNGNCELYGCYSTCDMEGIGQLGGLCGICAPNSIIRDCYATGDIDGSHNCGGLVGSNSEISTIDNCYALGNVTGGMSTGGFVGWNSSSIISNCFWNSQLSGQSVGVGDNEGSIINLVDATVEELQMQSTYTDLGWDFVGEIENGEEEIWNFHSALNSQYPYLMGLEDSYYENGILAKFSAIPREGNVPLQVQFNDNSLSEGLIISWAWDFDNDSIIDSSEPDPVWVYNEPGIYSVSLTVGDTNSSELSTEIKTNYIRVYNVIAPGGDGSADNPFLIETLENLNWVCSNQSSWGSHFLQINNIDASETGNNGLLYRAIGTQSNPFAGIYHGDGHVINGLQITSPDSLATGLFGNTNQAEIDQLGLTDVNISGGISTGGLAGVCDSTMVTQCYVSGIINGQTYTGSLVGRAVSSQISECYCMGSVSGDSNSGGLAGCCENGLIENSYSRSNVSGNTGQAGGFAGSIISSEISNCYTSGWVSGSGQAGSFAGYNSGTISGCIWNTETGGQDVSIGMDEGESSTTGASTEEMQTEELFLDLGWDFVGEVTNGMFDYWDMESSWNNGFPYIAALNWSYVGDGILAQFMGSPCVGPAPMTVDFTDESVCEDEIITWEWDFDFDGEVDSNIQNPSWIYTDPGVYTVSLTVADDENSSTETKMGYITVFDEIQPEGAGTESDPYLVESLDNLFWISSNEFSWNSYYLQTADIDASPTVNWNNGSGFRPLGDFDSAPFGGTYMGGGFSISGLYINRPGEDCVGMFGELTGAVIEDLDLVDINVTGQFNVGGLAGGANGYSSITNCSSSGNVTGERYVGGLTGNGYLITITECSAFGNVSGETPVGGLAGSNNDSEIIRSYAGCNVSGLHSYIGGLVGRNYSTIIDSYYDYETYTVNGQHLITIGALGSDLYNEWIEGGCCWDISSHLAFDGENYLIEDINDFKKLLAFGQNPENHFLLTGNISLNNDPGFYIPYLGATFDGDYHYVSGLELNYVNFSNIALFGFINETTVDALGVLDFEVCGSRYTGGLAGYNNYSCINECWVNGSVNGSIYIAGGIAAYNYHSSITDSYANIRIMGQISFMGGITGWNESSTISNSYVVGVINGYEVTGGIAGKNLGVLENCYMTGDVEATYSPGGLVGNNFAEVSNCVWNRETSGLEIAIGYHEEGDTLNLIGATTEEMQQIDTYTAIGWDFVGESVNGEEDIWDISEDVNDGFPHIYDIECFVDSNPDEVAVSTELNLTNYPNPFNPVTRIVYDIKEDTHVLVAVYNLKGQKVETLIEGNCEAGKHSVLWNSADYCSGVYFVRCITGFDEKVKKITLLK